MLRIVMEEGCSTQKQVLNYLGECFRVKLNVPDWYPNEQAAEFLFKYVCFAQMFLEGWRVVSGSLYWLQFGQVSHLGMRMNFGVEFWSLLAGGYLCFCGPPHLYFFSSHVLFYGTF